MLLVDWQIRKLSKAPIPMLEPFSEAVSGDDKISFGLTSAGYDLRLGHTAKIYKSTFCETIDPKRFKQDAGCAVRLFDEVKASRDGEAILLPPHSYGLFFSLEYIRVPRDLKGRCVGKSTYARCGIIVNTTPLEPNWQGHLTIEIANSTPCPVALYAGEGIAQLEFEMLSAMPQTDYAQKAGKYQGQGAEPVTARVL